MLSNSNLEARKNQIQVKNRNSLIKISLEKIHKYQHPIHEQF